MTKCIKAIIWMVVFVMIISLAFGIENYIPQSSTIEVWQTELEKDTEPNFNVIVDYFDVESDDIVTLNWSIVSAAFIPQLEPLSIISHNRASIISMLDISQSKSYSTAFKKLSYSIEDWFALKLGSDSVVYNFSYSNELQSNAVNDVFIYDRSKDTAPSESGWATNTSKSWHKEHNNSYGNYLGLDGNQDFMLVNANEILDFEATSENFTVEAWYYFDRLGVHSTLIGIGDANDDFWRMHAGAADNIVCSQEAVDVASTADLTLNQWYHFACVYNRQGNLDLYIDGVLNKSGAISGQGAMSLTTNNLYVGIGYDGALYDTSGFMDEVRIYNRTLSAAEVKASYDRGKNNSVSNITDGLVAYWSFDNMTNATNVLDDGHYKLNGTLTGDAHVLGGSADFPNITYIIASDTGLDIIDASDNSLWMRFAGADQTGTFGDYSMLGSSTETIPNSVKALNGQVYIAADSAIDPPSGPGGGLYHIDFINDKGWASTHLGRIDFGSADKISTRNYELGYTTWANPAICDSEGAVAGMHCIDVDAKHIGDDDWVAVTCRDIIGANDACISVANASNWVYYNDTIIGDGANPQVFIDANNYLIYSNNSDLMRNLTITDIKDNFGADNITPISFVQDITADKDLIFVGTFANVTILNSTFFNYSKSYAYSGAEHNILAGTSNNISSLAIDENNITIYVGTNGTGAVSEINISDNTLLKNWTTAEGLISNNVSSLSWREWNASRTLLLVGTDKGASIIVNDTEEGIDTIIPSIFIGINETSVEYGDHILIECNASDEIALSNYNLTILFPNGTLLTEDLITNTSLNLTDFNYSTLGNFTVRCFANDTSNNINHTNSSFAIVDTTAPNITTYTNQTLELGNSFSFDFNATDNYALGNWSSNNTINFTINNNTGIMINVTALPIATYHINVTINDTSGNIDWKIFSLTITTDVINPTIDSLTLITGIRNITANCTASDNIGVVNYTLNISVANLSSGNMTSGNYTFTNLESGVEYNVTCLVYDAAGNTASDSALATTNISGTRIEDYGIEWVTLNWAGTQGNQTGSNLTGGGGGTGSNDHSLLNNLAWSLAGHTFDTNLNVNGYNITDVNYVISDYLFVKSPDGYVGGQTSYLRVRNHSTVDRMVTEPLHPQSYGFIVSPGGITDQDTAFNLWSRDCDLSDDCYWSGQILDDDPHLYYIFTNAKGTSVAPNISIKPGNVETVKITTDGKVGIGESSPDSRLEIKGGLHITELEGSYNGGNATVCVFDNGTLYAIDGGCG